jgi:hypothetical protein
MYVMTNIDETVGIVTEKVVISFKSYMSYILLSEKD